MPEARGVHIVVAVACLLLLAGGEAQFGDYGHVVTNTEDIFENRLHEGGPQRFTYIDKGGNGLSADDAFFASRSTTLAIGDIALNDAAGVSSGQPIQPAHELAGVAAAEILGAVAFFDSDGSRHFSADDLAILDQQGVGAGKLSSDDLVLSGSTAGQLVDSQTLGLNSPVTTVAAGLRYLDLDASGSFDPGEGVYVDMDMDQHVTIGDVRLSGHNGLASGQRVDVRSPDRALGIETNGAPTMFMFRDENGDSQFTGTEGVYLARSSTGAGAVRLTETFGGSAGTHVSGGDSEATLTRQALSGTLLEIGNGDGRFGAGEALVFSLDGNQVASGRDIVLSGPNAGRFVQDTNLAGATGTTVPATIKYLDVDGNEVFSVGDVAYLDADANGFVSVGDVQLSAGPPAPEDDTDTETTPPPTGTQTPTDTGTSTSTDDETADDPGDEEPEPTIPMAFIIPGVLVALLIRRRF